MREFTVDRAADGRRLDALLGELTHGLPQPLLYKFLRKGRVRVNGKRISQPGHRLQAGDRLECYLNDEFFQRPSPENAYLRVKPRFQVVYEDENILLADKYPGLLVLPDREEGVNTLEAQIQRYLYDRGEYRPGETFPPALCNRIDRWTGASSSPPKTSSPWRRCWSASACGRCKRPTGAWCWAASPAGRGPSRATSSRTARRAGSTSATAPAPGPSRR